MAQTELGNKIDRWLLKKGFRAEKPLSTLRLIEARRKATDPLGFLSSRGGAGSVTKASKWGSYVPRGTGYRLFEPGTFPELPAIIAAGEAIYKRHETELNKDVNKRYFFNLMSEEDVATYPVLIDFALSKPVTEIATGYFGHVPRLHSLGIFYSAVNDTVAGSQIFHVDGDCLAQLKCFINVWGVESGGGEFTFLNKQQTTEAMRRTGLLKTITDEIVAKSVPPENQVHVFGAAGSGVFCDTSRCLHQGSRARERPRLVFQFQYVSRPDALLQRKGKVGGGHVHVTPALIAGLKLSNPQASRFVS